MPFPERVIDITAPAKDGLLRKFGSPVVATQPVFCRQEGTLQRYRFVEPTEDGRIHVDADLTGYTIEHAVGELDAAPTAGTFLLSYGGDDTGLTVLAYNITGAALQTALNANPAITAAGGVTVTQYGSAYEVRFVTVGAKNLLVADASNLGPLCQIVPKRLRTGDGSTKEIQWFRLMQQAFAYGNSFATYAVGTATVTTLQAGSTTAQEIQRVNVNNPARDGTILLTVAVANQIQVTCTAENANTTLHQKGFIAADQNGTIGVWYDVGGGGVAPAFVATCNRALEITTVTAGMSAQNVATETAAAFTADAVLTVSRVGTEVTLTNATAGVRTAASAQTSGFTITTIQPGFSGVVSIPLSATAQTFFSQLSAAVVNATVTKGEGYEWTVTFNGFQNVAAVTVDAANVFPNGYAGTLDFNTLACEAAFGLTDDEEIVSRYEVVIKPAGAAPFFVLSIPCRMRRNLIHSGASSAAVVPGVVGANYRIKNDGTLQLLNATTGLWHTVAVDGADGSAYLTLIQTGEA